MSFIIDQTVLFIKLTDTGRDLLSRGELKFSQFAVGDSEINYDFFRENPEISPENSAVLRPVDDDPQIFNFILKTPTSENLQPLPSSIANIVSEVSNTTEPRGVYDNTTSKYFEDPLHVKQPHVVVDNSKIMFHHLRIHYAT